MSGATSVRLPDGRLQLLHGPMDVLVECWGDKSEVRAAYAQAAERFATILDELVAELPRLREPVGEQYPLLRGAVARRMAAAVWPHREVYITPMAAVAGAVADEVMKFLVKERRLVKACVNNGGDIALHVSPGASLAVGIVANIDAPHLNAKLSIRSAMPVRGIATSGWRGRSQSLGIADAVTILARTAAEADAAATMVANSVNVAHPAIARRPARSLKEDSDLGQLPVTVRVDPLPAQSIEAALDSGLQVATTMKARGQVHAAYLSLQGRTRVLADARIARLGHQGKTRRTP
jgi:uncharacterized protein